MLLFKIQHRDVRAQCRQHVEQRGARRIQAESIDHKVGAGEEHCRAQKKRRRRKIAGNLCIDGAQRLRTAYRDRVRSPRQSSSKGAQSQFAVVSRAHGLAHHGHADGLQAGQQDATLHLRARNRRRVVDGFQRTSIDDQWRVAVGEHKARAHGGERLANALHGPLRK